MLILIYGDDTFGVHERVKQMKKAFEDKFDKAGLNVVSFPSDHTNKLDAGEVLQAVCSYPFLGPKRMVVVGGLIESVNKDGQTVWMDGFSRMPDTTIAVLWETASIATIEKKALFKALTKIGELHKYTYPQLSGVGLTKWTRERVQAKGGTIEPSALNELTASVGSDLWRMDGEIDKLVAYGAGRPITKEMVGELVHASFEKKIFVLMDAVSKKQVKRAVLLLEQERLAGSDDHYILTMLGRQVRILLSAKAFLERESPPSKGGHRGVGDAFASVSGLPPFSAKIALEQARLFTLDDLKCAHDLLFEYDVNIKTGRMGAGLAVDLVTDHFMRFSSR